MAHHIVNKTIAGIGQILSFFASIHEDISEVRSLINLLGWELPPGVEDIGFASLDFGNFLDSLDAVLDASSEEREDELIMLERIAELTLAVNSLVKSIYTLSQNLSTDLAAFEGYIERTNIHKELPRRLFDFLLASYFAHQWPLSFSILHVIDVFDYPYFEANPENFQVEHVRAVINYKRINTLLKNPSQWAEESYGWGTAEFSAMLFLQRLNLLFHSVGISSRVQPLNHKAEGVWLDRPISTGAHDMPQLVAFFHEEFGLDDISRLGLSIFGARATSENISDGGLGVVPIIQGQIQGSLPFYRFSDTNLTLSVEADVLKRLAILLRPGEDLKIRTGNGLSDVITGRFAVSLHYGTPTSDIKTLVSLPGGTSLQAQQISLTGGIDHSPNHPTESFIELSIQGCRLAFSFENSEPFLQRNLPQEHLVAPADFTLCWNNQQGISFKGSAGIDATFPLHVKLGPAHFEFLHLSLESEETGFSVEASTSGQLLLGPLTATISRMGVNVEVTFEKGNLGLLGLSPQFKAPTGIGLSIDVQQISGSGFLEKDTRRDRWVGALSLKLSQRTLEGLVLSEKGSLLGIVWAKGLGIPAPGGSIEGLGILIASDRRGSKEAFLRGLKNNVLDAVLFPESPVAQAPQLIATLSQLFPLAPNYTLFGIFLQWVFGSKSRLAVAEIGIIIEFKGTSLVRIYLLGQGTVKIPQLPESQLSINAQLFGSLDFEKGEYFLKISLTNSKLGGGELTGDGLVYYSSDKGFILSVGGFNPRYRPPTGALFQLNRLSVNLANSDYLRISFECYIALTSSSFQIGGRLYLWAGKGGFSLEGLLSLDVLARFNGEFFLDVSAEVSIKRGRKTLASIGFNGTLSGISQWRIKGKAKLKILFFKITIPVKFTLGRGEPAQFEYTDAEPILHQALTDSANWTASETGLGVAIRELVRDGVWIGGNSTLGISQTAIPLNETIVKLGPAPLRRPQKFELDPVVKLGTQEKQWQVLKEEFNLSLYQTIDLEETIRVPVFETMQSGLMVNSEGLSFGDEIGGGMDYEEVILDGVEKTDIPESLPDPMSQSGVGENPFLSEQAFYQKKIAAIQLNTPTYAIADENLHLLEGEEGLSYATAQALRNQRRRAGADHINIVHRYEVASP